MLRAQCLCICYYYLMNIADTREKCKTLLAAVPLALGRGDGAEFRQPLGIAIGGGLILSQLLTLYTTPIVYVYLDRFGQWARGLRRGRNAAFMPGGVQP